MRQHLVSLPVPAAATARQDTLSTLHSRARSSLERSATYHVRSRRFIRDLYSTLEIFFLANHRSLFFFFFRISDTLFYTNHNY